MRATETQVLGGGFWQSLRSEELSIEQVGSRKAHGRVAATNSVRTGRIARPSATNKRPYGTLMPVSLGIPDARFERARNHAIRSEFAPLAVGARANVHVLGGGDRFRVATGRDRGHAHLQVPHPG